MTMLHVNAELIEQIDATEFAYSRDRMSAVRDVFSDTSLVHFTDSKPILALMAPTIPNPYFNRILISAPPAGDQLTATLNAFDEKAAKPLIDVNPGAIDTGTARILSSRGFAQTDFHPLFVRQFAEWKPAPPKLKTRIVSTTDDLKAFQELYVQGWDISAGFAGTMKSYIEKWASYPGWYLFLASDGEMPISTAVLFVKNRTSYLADATTPAPLRGRGARMSLLAARIEQAKALGCEVLFSRADFGSVSHKNMEKIGIPMSYTRSVWKSALESR
jgi:hypothetical protein